LDRELEDVVEAVLSARSDGHERDRAAISPTISWGDQVEGIDGPT